MKKAFLILLLTFFLLPQFAVAQTPRTENSRRIYSEKKSTLKQQQLIFSPSSTSADFEKNISEIRQQTQQNNKEKEAEFTNSLRKNKNLTKIKSAERITTNFTNINTKRTDQMAKIISRMDEVLIKIKARRNTIASTGANMTTINSSVASAEAALTSAKALVLSQAQKTYTPPATNEANLKYTLGTTMKQLQLDLQTVQKTLTAVKQALYHAATSLRTTSKTSSEAILSTKPTEIPSVIPTISQKTIDTTDAELDDPTPIPLQ